MVIVTTRVKENLFLYYHELIHIFNPLKNITLELESKWDTNIN